jgi:hypothetical protein
VALDLQAISWHYNLGNHSARGQRHTLSSYTTQ